MPKRRASNECELCGGDYYAKDMCKPCYMQKLRGTVKPRDNAQAAARDFDYEDFWQWVKKELQIG